MKKQGALILGMGGDNYDNFAARRRARVEAMERGLSLEQAAALHGQREEKRARAERLGIPTTAIGVFYEGAVTQGYSTDAVDEAVYRNVVAAGYQQSQGRE
jgi:hypothetical protein